MIKNEKNDIVLLFDVTKFTVPSYKQRADWFQTQYAYTVGTFEISVGNDLKIDVKNLKTMPITDISNAILTFICNNRKLYFGHQLDNIKMSVNHMNNHYKYDAICYKYDDENHMLMVSNIRKRDF